MNPVYSYIRKRDGKWLIDSGEYSSLYKLFSTIRSGDYIVIKNINETVIKRLRGEFSDPVPIDESDLPLAARALMLLLG